MRKYSYGNVLRKAIATSVITCMAFSMTGCGAKDKGNNGNSNGEATNTTNDVTTEKLSYTFNDNIGVSPDKWNPHEWQSNDESYILGYTTVGLYDFKLNESKDNYEIIPEMAAAEPVDVTSEYAGNEIYHVPSDATEGYAFKIALNEKACWEDGTPINADTYIYSMKQLLDPHMSNYRAGSYTSGRMIIANAAEYLHSGQKIYTPIYDGEGYREVEDKDMLASFTQSVAFFGKSAKEYYEADSKDKFMDADGTDLYAKYSEKDYFELTEEAKKDILTISANFGDTNPEAYKEWCVTFDGVNEEVSFDSVGLIKTGDYEITFVLANPISDFYLHYSLSSNFLVYEDKYEAYKKQTGDIIKTTYGTSVDTYMSYGPYKLTEFQVDKQITMEKNENWYGYSDGKHEGEFQATKINTQIIEAQATALQLFLQGKTDYVELSNDDMATYRSSDFIRFKPQTYTSKLTFNTDKEMLKKRQSVGVNKTILASKDFRKGLSLAIDRTEFAAQCTATHKAGYGILNYNYVSDPATGQLYRNTPQAEKVLCDYYGVDSVDQITGYDREKAKELITKAYEEAYAAKEINDTDIVELEFLVYSSDDMYVKTINFIQEAFTAAAEGTPLEGRIKIKMTPDADYYDHARQGQFEIIVSTWGGSSMDPFGTMECYADPAKLFEYGFKPEQVDVTIDINGESITKSFYDWYVALCNGDYAVADIDTRVTILAAMEATILEENCTTPIYYRTSAELWSRKALLGSDDFVQIVEFGGVRHLGFAYDDAAWDAYCAENNNQLTY